jgi:hypothetical protein
MTTVALAMATATYAQSTFPSGSVTHPTPAGSVNGTTITLNQRITGGIIAWYLNGMPQDNLLSQSPLPPSGGGGSGVGGGGKTPAKPLPHPISKPRPYGASISSGGVPGMVNNGNGWVSAQGSCC